MALYETYNYVAGLEESDCVLIGARYKRAHIQINADPQWSCQATWDPDQN